MVKYLIEKKGFSALTVNAVNGWNAFHYCIPPDCVEQEKTEQYYGQIFSFMMEKEGADGIPAKTFNGENRSCMNIE
uniref:Uncharacterized protein n=1 Tax=Anopheles atroparvus TaxID=41427 RepID=A0A182J7C3_ANOAO